MTEKPTDCALMSQLLMDWHRQHIGPIYRLFEIHLDLSRRTFLNWRKGKKIPREQALKKIAKYVEDKTAEYIRERQGQYYANGLGRKIEGITEFNRRIREAKKKLAAERLVETKTPFCKRPEFIGAYAEKIVCLIEKDILYRKAFQ